MTSDAVRARKLAVLAIIIDILTFTIGFGLIFVAIGHDANSPIECTSTNGLCATTPPTSACALPLCQQGTVTVTVSATLQTGSNTVIFPTAFTTTPFVTVSFQMGTPNTATNIFVFPFVSPGSVLTWTAMPAAQTEFLGLTTDRTNEFLNTQSLSRIIVNLQGFGATGATLRFDYSTDSGSTWNALTSTVLIDSTSCAATPCIVQSTATAIPAAAKTQVQVRISGGSGDGVTSPSFGTISLWLQQNIAAGWGYVKPPVSSTQFTVEVQVSIASGFSRTFTLQWVAQI